MRDRIISDYTVRIIVDIVSADDEPIEYRASIYDEDGELIGENWGSTDTEAISKALLGE